MKRFALILIWLLCPVQAEADQELKPDDFAYGIPLQTSGDFPVYQLDLPLDVYKNIVDPTLSDLRVFNANGAEVPFAIEPGGMTEEEMVGASSLTVFPLSEEETASADALSVLIRRGSSKTEESEVNVTAGGTLPQKKIVAYLFPTSTVAGPLRELTLSWSGTVDSFVLPVVLEASDDLKSWRTVTDDAVISQLIVGETNIIKNQIEFPPTKANYLRLKIQGSEKTARGLILNSASAEYVTGVKTAERTWLTVKGISAPGHSRVYSFDIEGAIPVDMVEVLLPEGNQVISADLFMSDKPDEPNKIHQYSGILYRLRQAGQEMTTGPFRPMHDHNQARKRYWSLKLSVDSAGLDGAPSLKVGWVPEKLVFVAQGKGPYLLAYGSAVARKPKFDVASLMDINAGLQSGNAILQAEKILGGEIRLIPPPPAPPSAWKVWGKRAALAGMVLATLLLGWMAYRIAKYN